METLRECVGLQEEKSRGMSVVWFIGLRRVLVKGDELSLCAACRVLLRLLRLLLRTTRGRHLHTQMK